MAPDTAEAACAFLYDHWRAGTRVAGLPEGLRPRDRAEAYAVQARIEARSTAPRYGWKIAATSLAGQAHINVSGPLAGRILHERVLPDGGSFALGTNLMRVAELEFAFRFGARIAPRPAPWTVAEALALVDTLHPAIEIPDSRYEPFEAAGEAQLIADNACAHLFLLGAAAPEGWRALDLAAHAVWGVIDDGAPQPGSGAAVLGDPRVALVWLLDEASRLGVTIEPGEVVTTGTCLPPLGIRPGNHVAGDFGMLGTVSVQVA